MLMSNTGLNNSNIRLSNDRLVLSLLLQHGALTKAELSRMTGLTARSVQLIAERLLKMRLIKTLPLRKGKIGQPSLPLALAAEGAYSIGIKIGRRRLTVQKSDFNFTLTHRLDATYPHVSGDNIVAEATRLVNEIKSQSSSGQYAGIGLCMPQDNLSAAEGISSAVVADKLRQSLGEEVIHISDIEAASLGENWLTKAEWKNYYYFFIGTYISGALIINGEIYHGACAADFSDYPIIGQSGKAAIKPLRTYASLIHLDEVLVAAGEKGVLVDGLSGAEVTDPQEFSAKGQEIIYDWLEQAAYALAQTIRQLQPLLALEGAIIETALLPSLRKRLCAGVQKHLPDIACRQGAIGPSARSYGVAILPLLHYFNPQATERVHHA